MATPQKPAQDHPLANILINVIIPVLILSYLSKDPALQETLGKVARPWHIGPIKAMIRSADLAALKAAMAGWLDAPGVDVRKALSAAAAAQGVELG